MRARTKGQQGGSPLFAFTDPETRFFLLFPFLSLSPFSLLSSPPIVYTYAHEPVFAEASLVKVTTSSGGESESHFRDKRRPMKLYQRGGLILMAIRLHAILVHPCLIFTRNTDDKDIRIGVYYRLLK